MPLPDVTFKHWLEHLDSPVVYFNPPTGPYVTTHYIVRTAALGKTSYLFAVIRHGKTEYFEKSQLEEQFPADMPVGVHYLPGTAPVEPVTWGVWRFDDKFVKGGFWVDSIRYTESAARDRAITLNYREFVRTHRHGEDNHQAREIPEEALEFFHEAVSVDDDQHSL